jgi:glutathione S-transferase
MQLYYSKGACSLACRIIINEIGAPATYVSVDLNTKQTESGEDFKKINPKGAVPTLMTDNNEILTENAAILQYLADHFNATQLLPSVNTFERYHTLEWLNYIATELHKSFALLFYPSFCEDLKNETIIPLIQRKFSFVDKALAGKKFLVGENFSLPDGYLFVMLLWSIFFKFNLKQWPNLAAYFKQLKARPSIQLSLEQEGIGDKKPTNE